MGCARRSRGAATRWSSSSATCPTTRSTATSPSCRRASFVSTPPGRRCPAVARRHLADADAAIVTSYCPDGVAAAELVLDAPRAGPRVLRPRYAGDPGAAPGRPGGRIRSAARPGRVRPGAELYRRARRSTSCGDGSAPAASLPLYGSVDPDAYRPDAPLPHYRADLSYMGTYAADRQAELEQLLVEPARRLPQKRFLIGGAQYPESFPWSGNIYFVRHLPPAEHRAFYSSSRLTLNVTRAAMARMGYCPSGRLFEAAACGAPILSDAWEGLDAFFTARARRSCWRTAPRTPMAALETARCGARAGSGGGAGAGARGAHGRQARRGAGGARRGRAWRARRRPADGRPRGPRRCDVGHRPGRRQRHADPAARVLQGAAAGGQPPRRRQSSGRARSASTWSSG